MEYVIWVLLIAVAVGAVWLVTSGDPSEKIVEGRLDKRDPVAAVTEAVVEVVEKSLREKPEEWGPSVSGRTGNVTGVINRRLGLAVVTGGGPSGCMILMREKAAASIADVREIEVASPHRERLWQSATKLLRDAEAAEKIEALTDVVERVGGVRT